MESESRWALRTPGGIPYKLLRRSGTASMTGAEGTEFVEEIVIRADRLSEFLEEATWRMVMRQGYIEPHTGMRMSGLVSMEVSKITWESFDPSKPVDPFGCDPTAPPGTYSDYLRLRLHYTPSKSPEDEEPDKQHDVWQVVDVSANASANVIHGEVRNATWAEDNEQVEPDISNQVLEPTVTWTVRWQSIPRKYFRDTLIERLRDYIGKVNSVKFEALNDAPPETVLFTGWGFQTQTTWSSESTDYKPIELNLTFVEKNFTHKGKQITHQHVWRPGKGWQEIRVGGSKLYETADLNNIFL